MPTLITISGGLMMRSVLGAVAGAVLVVCAAACGQGSAGTSDSIDNAGVVSGPSVFNFTGTPAGASSGSYELGMKFTSDNATQVTHILFYKTASSSGSHVAHLWSNTGTLLATQPFVTESASGWQEVTLTTPVAIPANTTYVVS